MLERELSLYEAYEFCQKIIDKAEIKRMVDAQTKYRPCSPAHLDTMATAGQDGTIDPALLQLKRGQSQSTSPASSIPIRDMGHDDCRQMALYTRALFKFHIGADPRPRMDLDIPRALGPEMLYDAKQIAKITAAAFKNQSQYKVNATINTHIQRLNPIEQVPWRVEDYVEGLKRKSVTVEMEESERRRKFPGGTDVWNADLAEEAGIIVDKNGKILVWSLPEIITLDAMVRITITLIMDDAN